MRQRHRQTERQTERERDRQTDRQTDRDRDRQTDRQNLVRRKGVGDNRQVSMAGTDKWFPKTVTDTSLWTLLSFWIILSVSKR